MIYFMFVPLELLLCCSTHLGALKNVFMTVSDCSIFEKVAVYHMLEILALLKLACTLPLLQRRQDFRIQKPKIEWIAFCKGLSTFK